MLRGIFIAQVVFFHERQARISTLEVLRGICASSLFNERHARISTSEVLRGIAQVVLLTNGKPAFPP